MGPRRGADPGALSSWWHTMAPPSSDGEEELAVFIYSVVDRLPQADTPQVRLEIL